MDIKTTYEKLNAQIEKLFVGNVWKIGLKNCTKIMPKKCTIHTSEN